MSERRLALMNIRELLRHIQQEPSNRKIERNTGIDRRTVKRYRDWAEQQQLLNGPLPSHEALLRLLDETLPEKQPPQNQPTTIGYQELIEDLLSQNVQVTAIYQRLVERGFKGSYSAVLRQARKIQPHRKDTDAVVRKECQPGEEAQIDFGEVGRMKDEDGKLRKAWAFVMVLSWSRYAYVEFVFDQKVATWLRCHRNAFAFFNGVPGRLVIDNLKAGITQAVWDDPQVQMAYRECAEHYGFLILPCRPATPEHKGKVEGGVAYVQGNFMGGRGEMYRTEANREVLIWCRTTAGQRIHGTTKEKPLGRFQQVEQERLRPLPATPYDIAIWKQAKLHRDCYVVFEGAYYSAPFRLIGQKLWLCAGSRQVRLYDERYQLVATHERAEKPGQRQTHRDHLPPEKLPGLERSRESCLAQASQVGPETQAVVVQLLADPVLDRIHQVGRLLRLQEKYGPARLEAACQRALRFGDASYKTIKGILQQGTDQEELPIPVEIPPATTFARQPEELIGNLAEVSSWN
ncbi:MAG TPA: IS21 family transposase [Anaerolineaceae bacterium]|nr:IS21 family transposase [Anaerolineaceae bacterium]